MKKFENGYFSLLENVPFHDTFGSRRRKEFTTYLIHQLTSLSFLLEELHVWSEKVLEKVSFDEKEFRCDIVLECHDFIINLEAYTKFNKESLQKTICYGDKLNINQFEIGDYYKKGKKIIQIVLVRDMEIGLNKELITENMLSKDSILLSDSRKIILVRLDKIDAVGYNNEQIRLLRYLKARNQKEREEILKEGEDGMLKKMNEFVKRFMNNKEAEKKYEKYNFEKRIWEESGRNEGRNEGISIGRSEFARYLQSTGKSVEEISNTMELPISKIKELLEM